jgi:hypothetical protein
LEISCVKHFLKLDWGWDDCKGDDEEKLYPKHGQYLASINYSTRIHGRAPTEAEIPQYFRVAPPSVHQIILTLEAHRLTERTPGQARSIRLLIPPEKPPDLI